MKIKTVGFVEGKWEILLEDGSFLDGVTSINLLKRVGDLGKLEISMIIDEGFFKDYEKAIENQPARPVSEQIEGS